MTRRRAIRPVEARSARGFVESGQLRGRRSPGATGSLTTERRKSMPKRFKKSGIVAPSLDVWDAPAPGTDEQVLDRVYQQLDEVVADYQVKRDAILADKDLSAAGQKQKLAALRKAPEFASLLKRHREALQVVQMHHDVEGYALRQPDDAKDVAAQLRALEVRNAFRRLAEGERFDTLRAAVERGDATLVRAVLGAPTGFDLVPESLRGKLAQFAMEATDPARFAAWKRVERGLAVVGEALGVVSEYPDQESTAETRRAEEARRTMEVRGGGSEESGPFAEGEAAGD